MNIRFVQIFVKKLDKMQTRASLDYGIQRDVRVDGLALYFYLEARIPLKFGPETTTYAVCARVRVEVSSRNGDRAAGWGETPLSVAWVWPCDLPYDSDFPPCRTSVNFWQTWNDFPLWGHPMESGMPSRKKPAAIAERVQQAKGSAAPSQMLGWPPSLLGSSMWHCSTLWKSHGIRSSIPSIATT
jgi:hypothetical protein